jgi:hypothetical protein
VAQESRTKRWRRLGPRHSEVSLSQSTRAGAATLRPFLLPLCTNVLEEGLFSGVRITG